MRASTLRRRLAPFASSVVLSLLSCTALAQQSTPDRVVIFGASLSDTGNSFIWLSDPANQACGVPLNVPPYDALDPLKVPDGPYAMGGHHFTNGATWAEGLARALALAGNARPALAGPSAQASNYAVGGARAVAGYPCRFNLPAQVNTYLTDFPQTPASTLVTIEIGGNDVRDALVAAAGGRDPAPYIQNALASLGNSVSTLYAYGARRFLLLNVPDLGKLPAVRELGPAAVAGGNFLAVQYNSNLALLSQQLMQLLPGSDIRIVDIYAKLNQVVADPGAYGLANATDACLTPNQAPFTCTHPDTYVFWDGIHPTKAVHEIVAQQAARALFAH
jgi:phospholipase/lecithinase/hemolysin